MGEKQNRGGGGQGGAKRRKKPHKSYRRDVKIRGELGGRRKKRRQRSVGSVDIDRGYQEKSIQIEREARDAQA